MPELDVEKLARVLGMVGSDHDGEALNALRLADRMLRETGMGWGDLIAPFEQLRIATEATAVLLAENTALRNQIEGQQSHGGAVALWRDVGVADTDINAGARWALRVHQEGKVWLSGFEVDFLVMCRRWSGRLTAKQARIFESIVIRVIDRSGETPSW
jgi:hypothetical protein